MDDGRIRRALLSVSDKQGVVELARGLAKHGVEILSTGGTAGAIATGGVDVVEVSDYTGSPEILDGRVKTLHPKIHGGLLFVRGNAEHESQCDELGIGPIDMVVVNLYPFEQTVARPDVTFADAIENIDIGGPTMLRSASKNHAFVTIVVDPDDYGEVLAEMDANSGATKLPTRRRLATKAFGRTAQYDRAIVSYLESDAGR